MRIEKVALKDLISPNYNPRTITNKEMEKLKRSIKEFGYCDPLIVNDVDNNIIGGNQRYEAMKQLGFKEVEVSYVHITDQKKVKALNLRLNKMSGEWDTSKLNDIIHELEINHFDLSITGFDDFDKEIEFKPLLDKMEFEEKPKKKKSESDSLENAGIEEIKKELFEDFVEEFDEVEETEPKKNYHLTITFESEEEMNEAYDKLVEQGYNCDICLIL